MTMKIVDQKYSKIHPQRLKALKNKGLTALCDVVF